MTTDIPATPLIENPTEFFTHEELDFAQQGVLPSGQPAPQLMRQCDRPEDIAQTFVEVFNDLGGADFLTEWGKENPGAFINHLKALAPRQQQETHTQEAIVTFRHALPPSPLDGYDSPPAIEGEIEAVEAEIIEEIKEKVTRQPKPAPKRRKKKPNV